MVTLPGSGDIVKSRKFQVEGVVLDVLPNLYEAEAKGYIYDADLWFSDQTPKMVPFLKSLPWIYIVVYPEGSVIVPVSDAAIVSTFAKWFRKRVRHIEKRKRNQGEA